MPENRFHMFCDDALDDHDAVAIADLVRRGQLGGAEVAAAARSRTLRADPRLRGTAFLAEEPLLSADTEAPLFGVPTYVKDNTDVAGMPTNHGTAAFTAHPAHKHGRFTRQFLSTGMTVLGKSRMPEFGLNGSTEFAAAEPTRNPWHTDYTPGGSSGGAAAMVAAGVVPIAHGNDGGGSIRIPAAACGLVGLKLTRGRHINGEQAQAIPINVISEGVLTRSVRDTAAYLAAIEQYWRNPKLPPVGLIEGPTHRRMRIGVLTDSVTGTKTCPQTRRVLTDTATRLERMGHHVELIAAPVTSSFADDFTIYLGMLSFMLSSLGKLAFDRHFEPNRLDGFTVGLGRCYRRNMLRTPTVLHRLSQVSRAYAAVFDHHDAVLSPVLIHATPLLGQLSPNVPFDELIQRLHACAGFTPLHNIAGSPAISLPLGTSEQGLPIGLQLWAAHGDERTLLELAYSLEAEKPWPRIQDRLPRRTAP